MTQGANISSLDLLQRLMPAVRPTAPRGVEAAPAPFDAQSFDQLLEQAFRGEIHSERPVEPACDIQPPLNQLQLQRLADAADKAEASGAQRALMMLDGRGFVVDITGRAITAEMRPDDSQAMLHVDTAMVVPAESNAHAAAAPRTSHLATSNAAVSRLLNEITSPAAKAVLARDG